MERLSAPAPGRVPSKSSVLRGGTLPHDMRTLSPLVLCGSGTIAEASTRGLPVMLFNFLPGQEEGNVPFVIKSGFGDYSKEPAVIARVTHTCTQRAP